MDCSHFAGLAHCASCELTSNLWLCLTCGALGCGRAQYGGTGGNGHALTHFNATKHPACVKLGTITPEGGAGACLFICLHRHVKTFIVDVYCYACDDARVDPELTSHLAKFGIHIASQKKTEKSMTELVSIFWSFTGIPLVNALAVANRAESCL